MNSYYMRLKKLNDYFAVDIKEEKIKESRERERERDVNTRGKVEVKRIFWDKNRLSMVHCTILCTIIEGKFPTENVIIAVKQIIGKTNESSFKYDLACNEMIQCIHSNNPHYYTSIII